MQEAKEPDAGDDGYLSTSRAAVLADAEALLTCYGVGEESGAELLHAVVELCFTSSVRFLQPGLLLKVMHAPPPQPSCPPPPAPPQPPSMQQRLSPSISMLCMKDAAVNNRTTVLVAFAGVSFLYSPASGMPDFITSLYLV